MLDISFFFSILIVFIVEFYVGVANVRNLHTQKKDRLNIWFFFFSRVNFSILSFVLWIENCYCRRRKWPPSLDCTLISPRWSTYWFFLCTQSIFIISKIRDRPLEDEKKVSKISDGKVLTTVYLVCLGLRYDWKRGGGRDLNITYPLSLLDCYANLFIDSVSFYRSRLGHWGRP